jgi:hypothetical protein
VLPWLLGWCTRSFSHTAATNLPATRHYAVTEPTSYGSVTVIGKPMVEEGERLAAMRQVVERLVRETGITDSQAIELVGFLGCANWSSLVREARLIRAPRPGVL